MAGQAGDAASTEAEEHPTLVDPEVSRAKFAAQLEEFQASEGEYRKRGVILLDHGDLYVEVGFGCRLPITPYNDLVTMPLAVRFGFENYDVWAPSVELIDPLERRLLSESRIQALDFAAPINGNPRQILIFAHPKTKRVFLCKRGVREYHSHPEHDGDDWLLYRGGAVGTLSSLCELLERTTIRTVSGVDCLSSLIKVGESVTVAKQVNLRQQNLEAMEAQLQAQQQGGGGMQVQLQGLGQLPPEALAALQQQLQQIQGQ